VQASRALWRGADATLHPRTDWSRRSRAAFSIGLRFAACGELIGRGLRELVRGGVADTFRSRRRTEVRHAPGRLNDHAALGAGRGQCHDTIKWAAGANGHVRTGCRRSHASRPCPMRYSNSPDTGRLFPPTVATQSAGDLRPHEPENQAPAMKRRVWLALRRNGARDTGAGLLECEQIRPRPRPTRCLRERL
jgi:hypothetical protein